MNGWPPGRAGVQCDRSTKLDNSHSVGSLQPSRPAFASSLQRLWATFNSTLVFPHLPERSLSHTSPVSLSKTISSEVWVVPLSQTANRGLSGQSTKVLSNISHT